jgi:hypothetical protein
LELIFDGRQQVVLESGGSEVSSTNPLPVVNFGSLITDSYDYVSVAYPLATSEVYTFKTGGAGGTTIATVTLVYTDATKANLSTVTKT